MADDRPPLSLDAHGQCLTVHAVHLRHDALMNDCSHSTAGCAIVHGVL